MNTRIPHVVFTLGKYNLKTFCLTFNAVIYYIKKNQIKQIVNDSLCTNMYRGYM